MIIEVVSDTLCDTFGGLCGQSTAEKRKHTLKQCQEQKTQSNQRQQSNGVFLDQDIIDEEADEESTRRTQHSSHGQTRCRDRVAQAKSEHKAPKPGQTVVRNRLL